MRAEVTLAVRTGYNVGQGPSGLCEVTISQETGEVLVLPLPG